jgi:hypothetical protein
MQDVDLLPRAGAIGNIIANGTVESDLTRQFELQNRRSHELLGDGSCRKSISGMPELTAGARRRHETLVNEYFVAMRDENLATKTILEHLSVQVPLNSKGQFLSLRTGFKI